MLVRLDGLGQQSLGAVTKNASQHVLAETLPHQGQWFTLACLTMAFKLMQSASKKWRLLNGSQLFPEVIAGVQFIDGI